MSVIAWEYELVEKPFCQQLQTMGWEWIEGDPDLPETTERTSSREVILRGRLAASLRKINRREGRPFAGEPGLELAAAQYAYRLRDSRRVETGAA